MTTVIPEDELEFHFYRAGGPGGQNVNKVSTAVQMRFDVKNSPSLTDPVKARLMKLVAMLPYRWYFPLIRRITGG